MGVHINDMSNIKMQTASFVLKLQAKHRLLKVAVDDIVFFI
jgi:hypothetical protein